MLEGHQKNSLPFSMFDYKENDKPIDTGLHDYHKLNKCNLISTCDIRCIAI